MFSWGFNPFLKCLFHVTVGYFRGHNLYKHEATEFDPFGSR